MNVSVQCTTVYSVDQCTVYISTALQYSTVYSTAQPCTVGRRGLFTMELYLSAVYLLHYRHYELSNYGRKGHESVHNCQYWVRSPFLAFGIGATSHFAGVRLKRPTRMTEYKRWVRQLQALAGKLTDLSGRGVLCLRAVTHRQDGSTDVLVQHQERLGTCCDPVGFGRAFVRTLSEAPCW